MSSIQLEKARNLSLPSREEMLKRDYSVQEFWKTNKELLTDAWKEWDLENKNMFNLMDDSLIDPKLKSIIDKAWENPESEYNLMELLDEVSPGVYQFQLFDPSKIKELRKYLDKVDEAQIPLRPPYGIVLNRKGAMLDRRSEGYLATPIFQSLYQQILDHYMRPIARLLFPEVYGYDTQTFGFSIQYQPEKDTSIRMHTDASSVTLNVNLNLPGETYTGSEVDFHDRGTGKLKRVKFQPGVAIIHRGNVAHSAQPILSGLRTNLVLWLYGDQMQIPRGLNSNKKITPQQRWSTPSTAYDDSSPF